MFQKLLKKDAAPIIANGLEQLRKADLSINEELGPGYSSLVAQGADVDRMHCHRTGLGFFLIDKKDGTEKLHLYYSNQTAWGIMVEFNGDSVSCRDLSKKAPMHISDEAINNARELLIFTKHQIPARIET